MVSMMHINAKATPTNNMDFYCYIKAIEFVPYGVHVMPLVSNSLGADTRHGQNKFLVTRHVPPGVCQPQGGMHLV